MELAELLIDPKVIGDRLQAMLGRGYRVKEGGWAGVLVEMEQGKSFVPFAKVSLPPNDFYRISVSEESAIKDSGGPIRIVRGSIYMRIVREIESMGLGLVNYTKQPTDGTYYPN